MVEVPTGIVAETFQEFRDGLAKVDASAIYYHFYAARIRGNGREGDFVGWVERGLQIPEVAQQLRTIDPYNFSLEQLRDRLVEICDSFLIPGGQNSVGQS
jgi:hypothetical protein